MAKTTKAQTETPSSGPSGPPWVLISGVVAVVAFALVALYPRQDSEGSASGDGHGTTCIYPTSGSDESSLAGTSREYALAGFASHS